MSGRIPYFNGEEINPDPEPYEAYVAENQANGTLRWQVAFLPWGPHGRREIVSHSSTYDQRSAAKLAMVLNSDWRYGDTPPEQEGAIETEDWMLPAIRSEARRLSFGPGAQH